MYPKCPVRLARAIDAMGFSGVFRYLGQMYLPFV
jgi:hypothetical protein